MRPRELLGAVLPLLCVDVAASSRSQTQVRVGARHRCMRCLLLCAEALPGAVHTAALTRSPRPGPATPHAGIPRYI